MRRCGSLEDELARPDTIPGVDRQANKVLVAAIGAEGGQFPAPEDLVSWAGMYSGNCESAGERTSGKTRKWSALTEVAHGATRTRQPGRRALAGDYCRLIARRGKRATAIAVGDRIQVIVYRVLRDRREYRVPTPLAPDEHRRNRPGNRAVDQLCQLGFAMILTPGEDAAWPIGPTESATATARHSRPPTHGRVVSM